MEVTEAITNNIYFLQIFLYWEIDFNYIKTKAKNIIIQTRESAKKKITKICLHQCTPVGFLYYQQKVKPRFGYYFFGLRMFKRKIYNSEFIKL